MIYQSSSESSVWTKLNLCFLAFEHPTCIQHSHRKATASLFKQEHPNTIQTSYKLQLTETIELTIKPSSTNKEVWTVHQKLRRWPTLRIFFFFLIGIYSMQGWTATMRHGVTRKEAEKRLKDTENLFRKNLQLKDVC